MCVVVGAGTPAHGSRYRRTLSLFATCASNIIIEHNDDASSTAAADHDGSDVMGLKGGYSEEVNNSFRFIYSPFNAINRERLDGGGHYKHDKW